MGLDPIICKNAQYQVITTAFGWVVLNNQTKALVKQCRTLTELREFI